MHNRKALRSSSSTAAIVHDERSYELMHTGAVMANGSVKRK
jgi:hypothetical protein